MAGPPSVLNLRHGAQRPGKPSASAMICTSSTGAALTSHTSCPAATCWRDKATACGHSRRATRCSYSSVATATRSSTTSPLPNDRALSCAPCIRPRCSPRPLDLLLLAALLLPPAGLVWLLVMHAVERRLDDADSRSAGSAPAT